MSPVLPCFVLAAASNNRGGELPFGSTPLSLGGCPSAFGSGLARHQPGDAVEHDPLAAAVRPLDKSARVASQRRATRRSIFVADFPSWIGSSSSRGGSSSSTAETTPCGASSTGTHLPSAAGTRNFRRRDARPRRWQEQPVDFPWLRDASRWRKRHDHRLGSCEHLFRGPPESRRSRSIGGIHVAGRHRTDHPYVLARPEAGRSTRASGASPIETERKNSTRELATHVEPAGDGGRRSFVSRRASPLLNHRPFLADLPRKNRSLLTRFCRRSAIRNRVCPASLMRRLRPPDRSIK